MTTLKLEAANRLEATEVTAATLPATSPFRRIHTALQSSGGAKLVKFNIREGDPKDDDEDDIDSYTYAVFQVAEINIEPAEFLKIAKIMDQNTWSFGMGHRGGKLYMVFAEALGMDLVDATSFISAAS